MLDILLREKQAIRDVEFVIGKAKLDLSGESREEIEEDLRVKQEKLTKIRKELADYIRDLLDM